MNDKTPILVEQTRTRIDETPGDRLIVVLNAPGCAYARQEGGGCTHCSFPLKMAARHPVAAEDLVTQLRCALKTVNEAATAPLAVDLYNSGSFFNPDEIPFEAQTELLGLLAKMPRLRRVLVESRPEYVAREPLSAAVQALPGIPLEVGIGLESANDEIREKRIRKGFLRRDFERAAEEVAAVGAGLLVYVLLKPIDTSEREAIDDSVSTIQYVFDLGAELEIPVRAALEPCFVGPGTRMAERYAQGGYRPPMLWSAIEVLRRTAALGPIVVGLSDENLSPEEGAHNCPKCTTAVRESIARFNETQRLEDLAEPTCECVGAWRAAL